MMVFLWPTRRTIISLATVFSLLVLLLFTSSRRHTDPYRAADASLFHHADLVASYLRTLASDGSLDSPAVDWSQYAYLQYAADLDYLCNAIMLFEALDRLGSQADRLLMFPADMLAHKPTSLRSANLLQTAQNKYKVTLEPIDPLNMQRYATLPKEKLTLLLAFNHTDYVRILNLESDAIILQTMDELFLLPPAPIAMPHAYWRSTENTEFSSQLVLIEPSETESHRVAKAITEEEVSSDVHDKNIIDRLFSNASIVLPHRRYNLLVSEFRQKHDHHGRYLGDDAQQWNATKVLEEAKYVHFSDWPMSRPWIRTKDDVIQREQPECSLKLDSDRHLDCTERKIWQSFYDGFARRRKEVCGMELADEKTPKI